ncbi:MAG: hypothetical protein SFV21_16295, partial [Rhodospirillaceae bacterium]|nr:hypothetical protein [Rhodospirillaceae bacterium]
MPDDSAAQITPHAAVLTPPTRSPPRAPWPFVRDQLARGYVAPITGLGAIIALHALVDAVVPLVLGALVDSVVARDATPQNAWRSPWALFAALAALWVAGPQIARLYQLIHPRVFIPLRTRIYDELFAHVLGQS